MMIAGPAPGRSASPTMAVPVVAKIPAPIVAPTPSAVRCHLFSERLRPVDSPSGTSSAMGLRLKSCWSMKGRSAVGEGQRHEGHPPDDRAGGIPRGSELEACDHVGEGPPEP